MNPPERGMIAELGFNDRVEIGKAGEQQIVKRLRESGMELTVADTQTDMIDKIDAFLVHREGRSSCQIKFRDDSDIYRDFLLDLYEPFHGDGNPETKQGRDYVSAYDVYICKIKDTIYLVNGKAQKALVEAVLAEWRSYDTPLPVFNSDIYPGVQIRRTWDRKNHRPKLLMFIRPNVYGADQMYSIAA